MDIFRPTVFFRPKTISKVVIIKTESATIAFFSSPPFLLVALFLISFCFVTVILELLGLRNRPFDAFSLKWLQILLGWFSKKSVRCLHRILPTFQTVPFWSGKWLIRPFGINAAHFAQSILSEDFCQSFKMSHFQVANDVSGNLASTLLISRNLQAGFFRTLPPNGPFPSINWSSRRRNVMKWFAERADWARWDWRPATKVSSGDSKAEHWGITRARTLYAPIKDLRLPSVSRSLL